MARKPTSLLEEMLVAWAYTRDGVIAEVKNLPESALDFKPPPRCGPRASWCSTSSSPAC